MTLICGDCPTVGYPTDKTRCEDCPRREEKPMSTTREREQAIIALAASCLKSRNRGFSKLDLIEEVRRIKAIRIRINGEMFDALDAQDKLSALISGTDPVNEVGYEEEK